jgi:RHS repeat-associated protein
MHGAIDEVHIFNKALSSAEIRLLMNEESVDEIDQQLAPQYNYRYTYQGQFSERDLETGWSHFELREYDPVMGRWNVTDPAAQYWAPYCAMGNNPINEDDPSGGYSRFGAWVRSGFSNDIYKDYSTGEWGYNSISKGNYVIGLADAAEVVVTPHFGDEGKGNLIIDEASRLVNEIEANQALAYMSTFDRIMVSRGGDAIEPDYTIESLILPVPKGVGVASASKTLFAAKPTISQIKRALLKVHKIMGGPLPKGKPGKFGSPTRGDTKKGYRLDPAHPDRPAGDPESVPHINFWNYSAGKRSNGGTKGAIPILNPNR